MLVRSKWRNWRSFADQFRGNRGNHVEEEFGSGLAGGDVSPLVQNQQVEFGQVAAEAEELLLLIGFA